MSDSTFCNSDANQDFLIVPANEQLKNEILHKNMKLSLSPVSESTVVKFTCDYCHQSFKAKQGLTRHVQSHIGSSVPWKCEFVDCKYATSSKVKLHLHKFELHNVPLPLPKIAGGMTVNKKELVDISNQISEFSCFCGASFNSMFSLRAHKK